MSDLYLRIAGLTIHVAGAHPDLDVRRSPGSAPFVIDAVDNPDIRVRVEVGPLVDRASLPCLFNSGGPWQLFRDGDHRLFRFVSPALGPAPYKTARVSRDGTTVDVRLNASYFDPESLIDPLEYPLDELIVIHWLSQGRGLEIHGCGVMDGAGSGYLFAGQSGAGKSTIARLWLQEPGATILSDDRVIVRREADGFWMYGTPWHGEAPFASPARARLAHVFLLRQHGEHELVAIARTQAVARLFSASFPTFHDRAGLDFALGLLDDLAGDVPCAELGFAPLPSLPAFVRRQAATSAASIDVPGWRTDYDSESAPAAHRD